jgi:hypothetical protein
MKHTVFYMCAAVAGGCLQKAGHPGPHIAAFFCSSPVQYVFIQMVPGLRIEETKHFESHKRIETSAKCQEVTTTTYGYTNSILCRGRLRVARTAHTV